MNGLTPILLLAAITVVAASNFSSPVGCLLERTRNTTGCKEEDKVRMYHFSHKKNRCRGYMTCTIEHDVTGNVFLSRDECNSHCPATNCTLPVAPANGYQNWVNVSNSNEIKLQIFCNDGFVMNGSSERLCMHNGSWTGSQPQCKCQLPPVPINGDYQELTTNSFLLLKYSCNKGYNLIGPSERSCGRDGVWSGEEPKCINPENIRCPEPEDIPNGQKLVLGYSVGDYVAYSCVTSYVHVLGSLWRSCLSSGEWSGEPPQCGRPFITYDDKIVENGKVETRKGEKNVQIKCKMDPYFPTGAVVEWDRPENAKSSNSSWVENKTAFALQFNVVAVSDAGDYTCSIKINSFLNRNIRRRIAVRVLSREKSCSPHASTHPMYLKTILPGRIDLIGFFSGCPKPTVQWYKDDVLLTNTSRISITDKALTNKNYTFSVLEIRNPITSDFGLYRVVANNTEGVLAYDVAVNVPPYYNPQSKRKRSIDAPDNDVASLCTTNNTVVFVGSIRRSTEDMSIVMVKRLLPSSLKVEKRLKTNEMIKVHHPYGKERLRGKDDHVFIVKKYSSDAGVDFMLNRVYPTDIEADLAHLCTN